MAKKSSNKSSISKKISPSVSPFTVPSTHVHESFFDDFRRMQERMDSLFDHFWESPFYSPVSSPLHRDNFSSALRESAFVPSANVWENEKEVGVSVELPGMDKKDIQLHITPDRIEIRAEKKHEQKHAEKNTYAYAQSQSSFFRSFALPSHTDSSKAKAKYENGVLRVTVPKTLTFPSNARKLEIE